MTLDLLANRSRGEDHRSVLGPHGLCDESGQDLIEYGLLSAVISVAFVASIQAVADGVFPFFGLVLQAFGWL